MGRGRQSEGSTEVSFKASFEGKEGRAVTESAERKRIPDLPGITAGWLENWFSSN